MSAPLIVAVAMEESATRSLTAWRQRFFPVARNYLPAHLMMYHRLDGAAAERVRLALTEAAQIPSFLLNFPRLRSHAGFVGVDVEAPLLHVIKRRLDEAFSDLLVPQDRQGYRPHVTLVNKVEPAEAARSLAIITAEFVPFTARAVGLDLHAYAGGPWQLLERFSFGCDSRS